MNKTIWVCGACGKYNESRMDVGDASCYLNATECIPGSLKFDEAGRVVSAEAVTSEHNVKAQASPTNLEPQERSK